MLDYWIPKNFRIQITVKIQKFINGCLLRERTMLFNSCYYISIAFKNIFHELLILLTAIGNSSVVAYRTYNQEVMGSSLRTAIIIFLGEGKKNDCETYVSHIQTRSSGSSGGTALSFFVLIRLQVGRLCQHCSQYFNSFQSDSQNETNNQLT